MEFRKPTGRTPRTRGFHPKGSTTLLFKQRLKTQTLVQKDTVSSVSLLKTNNKNFLWTSGLGLHTPLTLAESHCFVAVSRSMREVSMSHSGNEHCRNDVCLLRRNHSAGLWTVVSRRGRGASAEGSRLLGLRLQGEGTEPEREQVLFQLKYIHDGIVQLSEHHKVDGKAGGTVLGGRIAREPGQSIVLLQNEP